MTVDLSGRVVMVVEDSYYQAMDAKKALEEAGATVVGPFAKSVTALAALAALAPDCALLDVSLGQGASFDVARALRGGGVPFLFFTGYDQSALPPEFKDVERLEKPIDGPRMLVALQRCCRPRGERA